MVIFSTWLNNGGFFQLTSFGSCENYQNEIEMSQKDAMSFWLLM